MHVYRPAVLPDNRRLVWYPLAICGLLSVVGRFTHILPLIVCPLLVVAIFPGLPIAFHAVFFLSVRITLQGHTFSVTDYAGDPFVSYPRRQKIALSDVAYVYHVAKEAEAHKSDGPLPDPFRNTLIRIKKYRTADADPRRVGAVARSDNGLVLSDREGEKKIYVMHFHDLSKKDWQQLARRIQEANKDISFLMSKKETAGLLGKAKKH
jgi:hypothetical protein